MKGFIGSKHRERLVLHQENKRIYDKINLCSRTQPLNFGPADERPANIIEGWFQEKGLLEARRRRPTGSYPYLWHVVPSMRESEGAWADLESVCYTSHSDCDHLQKY